MAHKKAVAATNNGRDSNAKRRGVKVFGSGKVIAGNIIVRQKGNKFVASEGVGQGKDFTLYAEKDGQVRFFEKRKTKFDGSIQRKMHVTVD